MLARALESAQKPEEAIAAWKLVLEDAPDDGVANHRLGLLLAGRGDHDEAAVSLALARRAMPEDVDLALALAASYESLERFVEAAPLLATVARTRTDDVSLYERLSTAHAACERYDAAAAAYQRVIDLGRRDAPSFVHLGKLFERGGQHDAALRAFLEAYRFDSNSVRTIRRIAGSMHALGRTAEAVQWLQGACRIDPRDAAVRCALGICYLAQGRRAEATAEYEILRQLDHALATKLYNMLVAR